MLPLSEVAGMEDTKSMMVVEDNPRARQALRAYMSLQPGIDITAEASNGLEAINMIRGRLPDIVLMDACMPVMDGPEAIRIIKQHWPQIKIVVLTIYPDYERDVLSAGADAFLVKGCSTGEMMSRIHSLLQTDEAGDPSRKQDGDHPDDALSTFCVGSSPPG
jgi:DNA-binding NarL/FixJ family response regulator